MSYSCAIKHGLILTDDEKRTERLLKGMNIDYSSSCGAIELFSGDRIPYHEEAFKPLAETAKKGSFIYFLGEDGFVWTLFLENGEVIDAPGSVHWSDIEPALTDLEALDIIRDTPNLSKEEILDILDIDTRSTMSLKNLQNFARVYFTRLYPPDNPDTMTYILDTISKMIQIRAERFIS